MQGTRTRDVIDFGLAAADRRSLGQDASTRTVLVAEPERSDVGNLSLNRQHIHGRIFAQLATASLYFDAASFAVVAFAGHPLPIGLFSYLELD